MKKRILILTNTSNGLYLFRMELIKTLSEHYSVFVLTADTGRLDELKQICHSVEVINIDRRGKNLIRDLNLFRLYFNIMKMEKPDLVLTYTIKPNIYGGICSRILRIPYAVNITGFGSGFQDNRTRMLLIPLYKTALKRAKVIFCENSGISDDLVENDISTKEKICILNGAGVNLDHFSVLPYPDNDIFKFLFIGRIMKEKGIEELLDAIKKINEQNCICELIVVGGMEEDYSEAFREVQYIKYYGKQMDVRPYIKAADCFVLPSYHEGMANTNLECAASGRPVITTDIPGCREAVKDEVSGLLCTPRDTESLYEAMLKMIETEKDVREKMGIAGRKHMEEVFDKKRVVKETIEHLDLL